MSSRRLVIMIVVAFSPAAQADILFVDDDNCPGPGSGTLADPFCSIQTAINEAVDTDEIVVAPGTYFETVNFLGKAITLRSSDGPEVTVIDAQFTGSVVTCDSGEGPGTVLQAFTINRGFNVGGGGMLNVGTSPIVIDCIFFANFVDAFPDGVGGGMFNFGGSPTVINCTFDTNSAGGTNGGSGGGMHNKDSSPTVIACTFMRNTAPLSLGAGGGMYNNNSNPIIMNCLFDANVGTTGGGVLNSNSSPLIINCSFVANNSGIGNLNSNPTITNCIAWANGSFQIVDIDSSSSTVSYSDVQGGWSGAGSNNIDADPLFVSTSLSNCCVFHFGSGCDDPDCEAVVCDVMPSCCDFEWEIFCATLASDMCSMCSSDYRLQPGSPCVDAGDNTAVPVDITTDLDGNPRFVDDPDTPDSGIGNPPIVDMGAYELQVVSVCPWDLDGDGNVFVTDLLLLLMDFGSCDGSPADFDGDGCVTVLDLLAMIANFGPCPDGGCPWDVNGDGAVDQADLRQVLGNLGPCDGCPEDVNSDGIVNGQDVAAVLTHFGPCPANALSMF